MSMTQALSQDTGWSAYLRLGFHNTPRRTVLATRKHIGPLAVQRPFYPEGEVCHVYLLHPPGGVVGGDLLQIESHAESGSHALVTTPGATKFYRSAGELARQVQQLQVADDASLEWMPQENIFFPGARVSLSTRIDLQGSARLAWWEINCLGRPVIDEPFDEGTLDAGLEVCRDGQPLLLERLRVDQTRRQRVSLLKGQAVHGTALLNHADERHLEVAQQVILESGQTCTGVTLVEDLLILRYLGNSTEQARKLFTQTWQCLRETLLRRPANTPRIWNT